MPLHCGAVLFYGDVSSLFLSFFPFFFTVFVFIIFVLGKS